MEATMNENNIEPTSPQTKRAYNKTKNGVKIGRPTDKSEEEIILNKRRLEREYSIRRGRFITKINYYLNRYATLLPQQLKDLPQETTEEVKLKCERIYCFVGMNVEKRRQPKRTA